MAKFEHRFSEAATQAVSTLSQVRKHRCLTDSRGNDRFRYDPLTGVEIRQPLYTFTRRSYLERMAVVNEME